MPLFAKSNFILKTSKFIQNYILKNYMTFYINLNQRYRLLLCRTIYFKKPITIKYLFMQLCHKQTTYIKTDHIQNIQIK